MSNRTNKIKILNDPIYGFVTIANALLFDLIEHRYFQRLRRITQMGVTSLVYPGANHTRFHHAIGCMHLMQKVVQILRLKRVVITDDEANALYIAILLHDIGHGAFSHALECSIVQDISHEEISLKFISALNEEFNGKLSLSLQIFEGKYHRKFFNQLVSSQLDIDRLDYLKRDSFYTGVTAGNISSDRLIAMMNVVNDELVIELKGIYSVENFLIARRLMYWQVYLHKTSLVAEEMLVRILKRAKALVRQGEILPASPSLYYFLEHKISKTNFTNQTLQQFSKLDDYDILWSIKQWENNSDSVLSSLSKMFIHRKLLKIEISEKPFTKCYLQKIRNKYTSSDKDKNYFIFTGQVSNQAYDTKKPIKILYPESVLKDIVKASDQLNLQALTEPVKKYYCCFPKELHHFLQD